MSQYFKILDKLKKHKTKLVLVSKTHPADRVKVYYDLGQRCFGESKVQELSAKYEELPKDIEWHMIGHLQSNKVKYIAPFVSMVHSVDSMKLLEEIDRRAKQNDRTIDILLQMKIAEEDSKFGLSYDECKDLLQDPKLDDMKNIRIRGLMGMSTFTIDEEVVRKEFRFIKKIFDEIKADFFKNIDYFTELSIGMSGDYEIAIEEGATMVRIGSLIMGERYYGNAK